MQPDGVNLVTPGTGGTQQMEGPLLGRHGRHLHELDYGQGPQAPNS